MPSSQQLEIRFGSDPDERGYNEWQEERREAMRRLARQMGLPLGHAVEIWLRGGIRLRGILRLREEVLLIEETNDPGLALTVDGMPFMAAEIESYARTD